MRIIKTVTIGLMLSASSLANAADLPVYGDSANTQSFAVNWSGVYIGGAIGHGDGNHNSNADTHTVHAFIDGLNSSGAFGGGTIGADVQRGNYLFGLFGDYKLSSATFDAGISFDGVSLGTASIEDGDSWVVAARAGYLFGEEKRALLYVLGGYGQQDVSYKIGDEVVKNASFSGFVAGAGGEYALSNNVFIGIEYQHFFGSTEPLYDGPALGLDNLKITDELGSDQVMAKLKIKFGGDLN